MAKIRCRKCNATIVIDGKANPPSVYTAAGEATTEASDDAGDSQAKGLEFTVDFGEGDQRTMTVAEIAQAYNAGQITQDTYLWAEGFADWKPLSEVEEVVSALGTGAAPAPAAAPWASAAASPARAAARTAARAPAPDLFGGIDAAGGEDDVATSAPDHSASRGGGGGGGGLGLGSSSAAGGSGTGARNESSVLFSLSALTSAASRPSSRPIAPAPSGAATREDSGLIDLKALTAAATKSEAAAPAIPAAPLISPLAASPLGIAAPLGTPGGLGSAAVDLSPPPGKSKNGLYIGGGIAVAAVAAVAIAFILRPAPAPAPAPVAPPPAVAAPTPPPTATPTPEVTATPPSTGTAETEEAPKAGAKPAAGGVKRPAGGATGAKKPAADSKPAVEDKPATAAPKPKKNPCGCAPGDLQCAMRCAAG